MRVGLLVLALAGILLLPGCEDLPCNKSVDADRLAAVDQAQLQTDIAKIDAYLAAQGITALADPSGVRYVVKKNGFGGTPCLENLVAVIYKGRLFSTGAEFETGAFETELKTLVLGWQIMLPQFSKGSKITIYVPSGYAYGKGGVKLSETTYKIQPNEILIFDIELTNIR